MSDNQQKKLSKADLMKEILGIRKNTDKKYPAKAANKQPQKEINLNKTTVVMPNSLIENDDNKEIKSIISMAVSRKKENFMQLKKWDTQRSEELQLHINAIEGLHNQVDKHIKTSIDNLETYIAFFKERAKCQEKLATSPVIDVRKSIQHNNLAKGAFAGCSLILNLVYDNSLEQSQRCQLLANTIRKVILKERLDQHSSQSHLNLLRIRQKIASLRAELTQCNKQAQKKSSLLIQAYTLNQTNSEQDFYLLQLSFVQQALQQTTIQKRLGQLCLDYLKLAINEQQKRRNILQQCMSIYMDALKYTYHLQKSDTNTKQPSSLNSLQGITQLFSLNNLLDSRIINLITIKLDTDISQLSIQSFQKYLMNFQFRQFTSKVLLLKQYNLFHQLSKNKTQPCVMIVTVDLFLHLFFNPSGVYNQPSVSYKIDSSLLVKSISDIKIQIKKKDQRKRSMMSYIYWDNKSDPVYVLQFAKRDNKQQFCVFLNKLI